MLAVISPVHAQVLDWTLNAVAQNQAARTSDPATANSSTTTASQSSSATTLGGQMIEPVSIDSKTDTTGTSATTQRLGSDSDLLDVRNPRLKPPAKPGEYESWIQEITGRKIKRFGADLLLPSNRDYAVPAVSTIPPDYALSVGDVVSIALTGSVEGSANFEIDRDGRIYLPNVGSVSLVGVRYRDLRERVAAAIGRKYRGYEVTVSIAKLRGLRVYVTGFANNPGAYSVNSLSTLVNAVLAAGGPSAGGSFRSVKLYRNGREVVDFDLYALLRKGDRSHDPMLQNEDVLFIPPAGKQMAVVGSIHDEAIYETRSGETLDDMVGIAGGPTNLADVSRVILYRLSERDSTGSRQIDRAQASSILAESGDIVQLLPQGSLVRPLERQQVIVRIEGEVNQPGNYFVAPGTPLVKVMAMAGGLTDRAYVFGTSFTRETVRAQQRKGYLEALNQMETVLSLAPINGDRLIDASERTAQLALVRSFLERLRQNEPDGRLVLDLTAQTSELPGDLLLENNDRIVVPPRVETVGVFGAVFRPASFLIDKNHVGAVRDFVERAGGGIRGADVGRIFVVRANGSVLTRERGALRAKVLPGDMIFVPVKTQSSSVLAKIRDISQILFQFGVGAAAISAVM
jgi:protein involved in polysaccharide export with SLBB domain